MSLEFTKVLNVSFGSKSWKPVVFNVEDTECIKINPREGSLVNVVIALGNFEEEVKELSASGDVKKLPALTHLTGYLKLKELRSQTQAEQLTAPAVKSLLSCAPKNKQKKKKRTSQEVLESRLSPALMTVVVDGGKTITMQRPIHAKDALIVSADEENLSTFLHYLVETSAAAEFFKTGDYKSSGMKGVWKYGEYYYTRGENGMEQVVINTDGHCDDGADVHDEATDVDGAYDGVVAVEDLPDADDA